jgi:hypothetical protein
VSGLCLDRFSPSDDLCQLECELVDEVGTMKLLIAVDSVSSAEVLVDAVGIRPWPEGTTAHVLSVVADMDVPEEVWREEGYGRLPCSGKWKGAGNK